MEACIWITILIKLREIEEKQSQCTIKHQKRTIGILTVFLLTSALDGGAF